MKRKRQNVKQTKALYVSCVQSNTEEGLQTSDKLVPKLKVKRIKLDDRSGGVNKKTKALLSTTTETDSSSVDIEETTDVKHEVPTLKRISIYESNNGVNNEPKASCSKASDTKSINVTTEENTAEKTEGKSQNYRYHRSTHVNPALYVSCLPSTATSLSKMTAEEGLQPSGKLVRNLKRIISINESSNGVNNEPKPSCSKATGTSNVTTQENTAEKTEGKSQLKVPKLKVKSIELDGRIGGINKKTKAFPSTTTDIKSSSVDIEETTEVQNQVPNLRIISFNERDNGVNNEPKASCSKATVTQSSNVTTEENTAEKPKENHRQRNLTFVGRRINHQWKLDDGTLKWYMGTVISTTKGTDGHPHTMYQVLYDGEDKAYDVKDLRIDYHDGSLKFSDL